jgi:putative flippase GtrA
MTEFWARMAQRTFVPIESTSLRYVAVGGAAALGYFAICYVLQEIAGWAPFWASAAAYAVMFGCAYLGQRNIAFRSARRHRDSLPAYLLLQILCALLAAAIVQFLVAATGHSPLVASAIATIIAGGASYIVSASWIFFDHGAARRSAEISSGCAPRDVPLSAPFADHTVNLSKEPMPPPKPATD